VVFSVLASGCDSSVSNSDKTRPIDPIVLIGVGAPVTFETSPVKLRLTDLRLVVPANCLDAQVTPKGVDEAGFTIDTDLLIAAVLPQLECRSRANRAQFEQTGHTASRVSILISSIKKRLSSNEVVNRLYRLESRKSANVEIVGIDEDSVTSIARAAPGSISNGDNATPSFTAISALKSSGFTVCKGYNRVPVPQCKTTFPLGRSIVDVRYAAGHLHQRNEIEAAVKQRLAGFIIQSF
jgi:hypothetical protein